VKVLPPEFYLRDTVRVAKDLLGKGLVRRFGRKEIITEIVEVEAYLGTRDRASHARMGPTKRNASMFLTGGHCYVYLSYGMHYCMNVVTREEGRGEAVLLRALAPLSGEIAPTNGPGRLTKALGITIAQNGWRLDRRELALVDFGRRVPRSRIGVSPRIGITQDADLPLRFFIKDSEWLSR
jgi:DNA-3-methyladenine glycosylase